MFCKGLLLLWLAFLFSFNLLLCCMCIRTGSLPNSRAALPLCSAYIFKFDISTRLHQMFCHRAPAAGRHQTHGTQIKNREDPSAFNMWGTWSHLYRGDLTFAPKNEGSGTSEQLSEQHKVKKLGGKSTLLPQKNALSGFITNQCIPPLSAPPSRLCSVCRKISSQFNASRFSRVRMSTKGSWRERARLQGFAKGPGRKVKQRINQDATNTWFPRSFAAFKRWIVSENKYIYILQHRK